MYYLPIYNIYITPVIDDVSYRIQLVNSQEYVVLGSLSFRVPTHILNNN